MPANNPIKILFRFYSDILEEEITETMLAEVVDLEKGYYKIDSLPFYATIALGDIVWAEFSLKEETLTYRKTVEPSGNSTIHAIITDNTNDIDTVRSVFKALGCESVKQNEKYFALEVPAAVNYFIIKENLDELVNKEIIDYAETCLSLKHQYKNFSPF